MEFTLSQEQKALVTMVRELMEEKVKPRTAEIDERGEFPAWVRDLFVEQGLFSTVIPAEYGGFDGSLLTQCLVVEEVARVCASSSMMLGNQSLGSAPITLYGSEAQKAKWLPRLATGEIKASFGLTEPGAGSDVHALLTRAERGDGGWVINGSKCFITEANIAAVVTVFAKVRHEGKDVITAFLVETDRPGFSVDKVEHKMGLRGSPTCSLTLDGVWVPEENILGNVGDGFAILLGCLNKGRISVAAQSLGIAQGAFEAARDYAKNRVQFGQPLAKIQAVQLMIADMVTEIEAARALTHMAAWHYDNHTRDMVRLSGAAKLYASDVANRVTTNAVQILGGYGYIKDYPVERMMRDAKIFQIFEGTNQIQRLSVAREALK